MNTKKFSSVYLLIVLLTGALVLAPAVTAFAFTDEAPDYTKPGATDVKMLSFDVTNTSGSAEAFTSVTVSTSNTAAVDTMYLKRTSNDTTVASTSMASSPTTMSFSETIPDNGTVNYYLSVDVASGATEGNSFDAILESITAGSNTSTGTDTPLSSGSTTIDGTAPTYDSAITGNSASGNSTATKKVYLKFTEADAGLDSNTVETSDFSVGGTEPSGVDSVGTAHIILSMSTALNTGATPSVDLVGSVSDAAGNSVSTGSYTATDGLKPQMDSVETTTTTTIKVTYTEDLDETTLDKANFSVDITPNVDAVSEISPGVIEVTLDATMATDATPKVTYTAGSLADLAGNTANGDSIKAEDGLKPVVSSVSWSEDTLPQNTNSPQDTLTVTFGETIAIPGLASDYSVTYDADGDFGTTGDQRSVNVKSVTDSSQDTDVTLNIADQSYQSDPGGKFKVTLDNPGNVKDVNGVGVNPSKNTAKTSTVTDFVATTAVVSAKTTSKTTLKVTFNEDLDGATVDKADFAVGSGSIDGYDSSVEPDSASETAAGVITLTLASGDAFGTGDTPAIDYSKGTLEDVAGNLVSTISGITPSDGVAPTMDSATATTTTAVEVTFSESLDSGTVDASAFDVGGVTPDSANASGSGVVTLGLASDDALSTDATPSITYTAGNLADSSGNTAVTTTVPATDGISPVLNQVAWTDVDGNGSVSENDTFAFTFSEPMDETTVSSSSLDSDLVPSAGTYGTGAYLSWNSSSTVLTVTLPTGVTISAGATVDPASSVTDAGGNADGTPAGVMIESLDDPVTLNGVHYSTIQAAIDAADSNAETESIIKVAASYDAADSFKITVDKPVTITSAGAAAPTIDADGASGPVFETTDSVDVTLENLVIKADADQNAIVHNSSGKLTVKDSDIELDLDSALSSPPVIYGIKARDTGAVDVSDTNFLGSEASGLDSSWITAVDIWGPEADGSSFENISIKGSSLKDADGIHARGVDNVTVKNSTFKNYNGFGLNIGQKHSDDEVTGWAIEGNEFNSLARGIFVWYESGASNNIKLTATNNDFMGNSEYGIAVYNGPDGSYTASNGSVQVDAVKNYWGAPSGPDGAGDDVTANVTYEPWLNEVGIEVTSATQEMGFVQGFQMVSPSVIPFNDAPGEVFDDYLGGVIAYDEVDNEYKPGSKLDEVKVDGGYWLYATSPTGSSDLSVQGAKVAEDWELEFETGDGTWYMISVPFDTFWSNVEFKAADSSDWKTPQEAKEAGLIWNSVQTFRTDYNSKTHDSPYKEVAYYDSDSGTNVGMLKAGTAYWIRIDTAVSADLPLKMAMPYEPGSTPGSSAMAAATSAAKVVPADAPQPPAPPMNEQASGELKATAAVTSEGVTFEVSGADVSSMNVQVFTTGGQEIFSESANANSLAWDADVSNGLYLYGVTAEVNGEATPLGIQKLLILN